MSIIIHGVDMPKKYGTGVAIYPNGVCIVFTETEITMYKHISAEQLPPHGRLIDADALLFTMVETLESLKKYPKMDREEAHLLAAFHTIGKMVKDMPTIIEAEGERE